MTAKKKHIKEKIEELELARRHSDMLGRVKM